MRFMPPITCANSPFIISVPCFIASRIGQLFNSCKKQIIKLLNTKSLIPYSMITTTG
ncbi:hypothetical protein BN4901_1949 [Citrobacter europaeus]|uniref:Uncharacterized protein n=1 Tax=Citrobacter europaeus TaxID=1914243 RepID=A0ABY0JN55_9ENTR|nr:hypothetical protein BN4901_1949 [Citrobacter europaeus]